MVIHSLRSWEVTLSGGLAAVAVVACGVRSPLGDGTGGVEATALEARVDAGAEGTPGDRTADSGARGGVEAGSTCAQMLMACEAEAACTSILNCVLLKCAAAGASGQMTCAIGCSGGNFQQLSAMLPLFNCLQGNAGADGGGSGGLAGWLGAAGGSGLAGLLGSLTGTSSGG